MLLKLNGEKLQQTTANRRPEARLDIITTGFWTPGQRVFLDERVFYLNGRRYKSLDLQKCVQRNRNEKKRAYNERVLEVENTLFTHTRSLVFVTNG